MWFKNQDFHFLNLYLGQKISYNNDFGKWECEKRLNAGKYNQNVYAFRQK